MERIEAIRRACEIGADTMEYAVNLDAAGMTEKEVASRIDSKMRELGASGNAFDTIVAAAENGAEIHHEPTDRVIEQGEPVIIDLGCVYEGYCSDMTRTLVFGNEEPSRKFRKVYDIVEEAQKRAIHAVEPGVNGGEVDGAARSFIEEKGYDFDHLAGHGVGADVHDKPKIGPESDDVISESDVIAIEPGVYIEGEFGVRIEDCLLVGVEGVEHLSSKPSTI